VSIEQIVVAKGSQNVLKVESNKRITSIQTFQDLLAAGSKDDVLEFLRTENLTSRKKNFSFRNLLYLLEDKDFFTKTIQTLRDRGIFSSEVWQYAFFHKDDDALMSECIKLNYSSDQFNVLGTHFTSGLVTINELNAE
jgi:hypothetical protein